MKSGTVIIKTGVGAGCVYDGIHARHLWRI